MLAYKVSAYTIIAPESLRLFRAPNATRENGVALFF